MPPTCTHDLPDNQRIVITGIGLTAPNGNHLSRVPREPARRAQRRAAVRNPLFRQDAGRDLQFRRRCGIRRGRKSAAAPGPAASASTAANEAVQDAGLDWHNVDKARVGVYVGVTEHGNVETENEIHELKNYDYDTSFWSHHHNPRTVANNPAGEISLNMGITGPHYTIGAACAAGQRRADPGRPDAAAGRVRLGAAAACRRASTRSGSSPVSKPRCPGRTRRSDQGLAAVRLHRNGIVVAEGGACSCSSV